MNLNFGFFPISSCFLANLCPVPIVKIFVMLQKMFHLMHFHRTVCTYYKVFYILCIQLSVKII